MNHMIHMIHMNKGPLAAGGPFPADEKKRTKPGNRSRSDMIPAEICEGEGAKAEKEDRYCAGKKAITVVPERVLEL